MQLEVYQAVQDITSVLNTEYSWNGGIQSDHYDECWWRPSDPNSRPQFTAILFVYPNGMIYFSCSYLEDNFSHTITADHPCRIENIAPALSVLFERISSAGKYGSTLKMAAFADFHDSIGNGQKSF
jgi:hypothetical protein